MRKIVDWRCLRRINLLMLIDVLIKPILMYGCEIWLLCLAGTTMVDAMNSGNARLPEKTVRTMLGTMPFEHVHLQMMKWILGVNKKTSNSAIYGNTGRYLLSIVCSKVSE